MADVVVGAKLEADASGAINSVKNFKQELKLAQQEVVILSEKFGVTSKEAAAAAKKAAELTDKISDARQLVDAFNPDTKFRAFGASIQTVIGGFTALTGAMGLLGIESEEVQKTLLKVQSALALSQGVAQLQEGIGALKNLGSVLVNTLGKSGLIGIAIAGVAALGAAFFGLFKRQKEVDAAQKALSDTTKEYTQAAAGAIQKVAQVKTAFQLAKEGVITKDEALKTYNETLGDSLGKTNDILVAEKNLADKAETYIKITGLKAQANALFAKSAEAAANALIAQQRLDEAGLTGKGGSGIVGAADAAKEIQQQIDKTKKDAEAIQKIGENLLRQAGELAKAGNVNVGGGSKGGTGAGTPAEQAAVSTRILTERISTEQDLLRQQEEFEKKQQEDARLRTAQHYEALSGLFKGFVDNSASLDLQRTHDENTQAAIRQAISEEEARAKEAIAEATANTLGAIADLIGRETAAGKVLAIAQATINTYLGASKAIAQGGIFGTIAAIGVIAAGLAQVKNIIKVKIPGKYDTGGGSVGSVTAPLQPQLPTATNTRLDRDQLNQIGNAATRAFVVESDVTNNQERIRRLNRAARIG